MNTYLSQTALVISTILSPLLVPIILIIIGGIWCKKPPKKVNGLYGYRTVLSMKNDDTWLFAHKHLGVVWLAFGIVMLVPTIIAIVVGAWSQNNIAGVLFGQVALIIISVFPTYFALKKTFDENGERKNNKI